MDLFVLLKPECKHFDPVIDVFSLKLNLLKSFVLLDTSV